MMTDGSEQVGRTLQYLYRIKQEHKHIAERLDSTQAAQNATQGALKELLARMAQVERQSSQIADDANQSRQSCLTAHTGMNRGLEEVKVHIERQYLKTKVLETNDHEKDGRLKTFLGMIQDVSQRLDQQEQSTALLLKSKGKLTKRHDGHDLESQVVMLETENRGMRGELEAVKLQSGQLATDFKKLQEELMELKRERSENLVTQVRDTSTVATVLVPRTQPEETQEPEMTQEQQQSFQPAQTRKRTRTISGFDVPVQQSQQTSQSSQSQGHVYVRRSPRNHPESQSLVEPRRSSQVSSQGESRQRRPLAKRLRGTETHPPPPSHDPTMRVPPTETQAIEVQGRHAGQKTMSLTQDPKTKNLVFRYADTQHARERIESIFARSDPAASSTVDMMHHVHNPTQLEMTKKARSRKTTGTISSPRKRKSSAGENTLGGSGHTVSTGQDGSLSMNQGYPRLDQRRTVETRRSTRLETQMQRQTQEPNHGLEAAASAKPKNQQPEQVHRKQTGQDSHAQSRPTKRKKRFLPVYDLPPLQDW